MKENARKALEWALPRSLSDRGGLRATRPPDEEDLEIDPVQAETVRLISAWRAKATEARDRWASSPSRRISTLAASAPATADAGCRCCPQSADPDELHRPPPFQYQVLEDPRAQGGD